MGSSGCVVLGVQPSVRSQLMPARRTVIFWMCSVSNGETMGLLKRMLAEPDGAVVLRVTRSEHRRRSVAAAGGRATATHCRQATLGYWWIVAPPGKSAVIDNDANDDADHLRRIVAAHGRIVETYLAYIERDAAVREELWADVVGLAYQHLDELHCLSAGQVRSWLLRTARNLTANAARRAQTRRRLAERLAREPVAFVTSAEDEFIDSDLSAEHRARSERIRCSLDQLSDGYRRILTMDALGQNGPLIAAQLGISHQAARSRLMRARNAFITAFTADDEVDSTSRTP